MVTIPKDILSKEVSDLVGQEAVAGAAVSEGQGGWQVKAPAEMQRIVFPGGDGDRREAVSDCSAADRSGGGVYDYRKFSEPFGVSCGNACFPDYAIRTDDFCFRRTGFFSKCSTSHQLNGEKAGSDPAVPKYPVFLR